MRNADVALPLSLSLCRFCKFFLWLLIGLAALPAVATPKPKPHALISSPRFTSAERADLAALPPPNPAERQAFAYLSTKTDKILTLPEHPTAVSALGHWFFARQTTSHDPAVVYPLLYANMLIARGLFSSPDVERKRLGLVVARYSEIAARINLHDYTLDALICEAFLVPHLDIAYPENGHTVSRRQILEDTYNAYAGTGDTAHQITTLLFLLRYSDSPNTKNWARMMLAQSYEQAKNYGQAIAFLQTTDPVDQAWLSRLNQEQAAKNGTPHPAAATASPKGSHS